MIDAEFHMMMATASEGPTPAQERDHLAEQGAELLRENRELRALLAKAYQFISPHSDPMGISNTQMAAEIMTAIGNQQSAQEPK